MARKKQELDDADPVLLSGVKRAEKQEDTRSTIAIGFVIGYAVVVALLMTLTAFKLMDGTTVKDFLLAIGSPLGFIIGFYFKNSGRD
ncbi:MAG TPA: hypothetical protein VM581_04840 [Magnetospirillaceae bacterium]|nr:hypothetical protein [Magnetospirillaceae bacterium]